MKSEKQIIDANPVIRNIVQSELNRQGAKDAKENLAHLAPWRFQHKDVSVVLRFPLRLCGSIIKE